jgi:hypothetical protein
MSEKLLKHWIKTCRPNFECEKADKKEFDKMTMEEKKDQAPRMFPHEFLFLLCNTKNRNALVN